MQKACRNGRPVRIRMRRVRDEDRKRAARACQRCKTRKNKCVEGPDGVCQRCLQGPHECVYEAGEARDRPARTDQSEQPEQPGQPRGSDTLPRPMRQESLPESLPDGIPEKGFLSRLREAFSLEAQPTTQPPLPRQADLDVAVQLQPEAMTLSSRGPPPPVLSAVTDTHRLRQAVAGFPPRRIGEFLLAVCVEQGLDSFFYFDQAALTTDLARFYDGSDRLRHDPVFVCLCLSVFALGSQWTALARPAWAREQHVLGPDPEPGQMLYGLAQSLVPDIMERPCVQSVQAALVMGVYLAPANVLTATYVYLGLALRMAMALGMHLEEAEDSPLSGYEAEVRRRLWWTTFSLERTLTLKLNRPRSIAQGAITVRLPRPLPTMDVRQRFDNLPHQLASAQLVRIQDQQTKMPADVFLAELKRWKRSLPACLRLENVRPHDKGYRAVVHLHMHYYHSKISLFKIAVVRTVRVRLRSALGGEVEDAEDETAEDDDRYPWEVCKRAATKTLGLFRQLAESRSMARFSYTDFQGCSLATIVELVAGVLERDADYEERVQKLGMGCLRLMAEGNATAKMGVRFVEAVAAIAEEARERLCQADARRQRQRQQTTATEETRPTDLAGSGSGNADSIGGMFDGQQAAEYSQWAEWVVKTGGTVEEEPPLPESLTTALSETALPADLGFAMDSQHLPFHTLEDRSYLMDLTGLGVLNFGPGEWEFL